MNTIQLCSSHSHKWTAISNLFIDQYMPEANGSYVKVYLYLLRQLSNDSKPFSISDIADCLDNTEKDIYRALNYWKKKDLLTLSENADGHIIKITITDPEEKGQTIGFQTTELEQIQSVKEETAAMSSIPNEHTFPEKSDYAPEQIAALTKDEELKWLLDVLEQYLNAPLSIQNTQLVLYLYESIGFSTELILYLYEYCISRDKRKVSYIETVAISWAKQGIDTVEKAEQSSAKFNSAYNAIMKTFGLNRIPADIEKKFIDTWLTYGFHISIIKEACNRAILNTKKPDFKYADRILANWKKQGIRSKQDIEKTDEAFSRSKSPAKPSSPSGSSKKNNNQFQNFPQRQYSSGDYSSLEQKLLQKK